MARRSYFRGDETFSSHPTNMSAFGFQRNDFIYSGQGVIPRDVTHVIVHPSVKVIPAMAFYNCFRLTNVKLPEGLEEIGERAFHGCTSLHRIVIPPFVKVIPAYAFSTCWELRGVVLHEGLEKIGEGAFSQCTSLHAIVIPSSVKVIDKEAFSICSRMTNVQLHEGLEKIGERAFGECTLLHRIVIPSSVNEINNKAFNSRSRVEFCEEIEEFVSGESMRDWWNHGRNEKSLSTYFFLARCNIPERVGLVQARKWQFNIHEMLRCIPSISPEDLSAYFESIDSKLSVYENLKDVPMLLELAIYQKNGILNTNTNIDDILNTDIVPHILSFFTDR